MDFIASELKWKINLVLCFSSPSRSSTVVLLGLNGGRGRHNIRPWQWGRFLISHVLGKRRIETKLRTGLGMSNPGISGDGPNGKGRAWTVL